MITILAFLQCVQCARTAEAMGLARLSVLWQGVWILLLPPLAVFGGILYVSWKRSRQADVGMASGVDSRMGARR
jgi:CHASE2 domain-containing sensor protein